MVIAPRRQGAKGQQNVDLAWDGIRFVSMATLTAKTPRKTVRRVGSAAGVAKVWDKEIRARVKAVDESRVSGITYEQIVAEMAAKFGR